MSIGLFQKKSTHPPTDEIVEILAGGGVKGSGNLGGRGGVSSAGVISTDSSRDSNVFVRWHFGALKPWK